MKAKASRGRTVASRKKSNPQTNADNDITIITSRQCKSLSGNTDLTYELGKDSDKQLHIRITANSSSGYFNPIWVSINELDSLLSDVPKA